MIKEVFIIDVMTKGPNQYMVYDVSSVWATRQGAMKQLQFICDRINDSNVGLLRASIENDTCSVESSESGQWLLLSRYHILQKRVNFD